MLVERELTGGATPVDRLLARAEEPDRCIWFEEHPIFHTFQPFDGMRRWIGSSLWRIVDFTEAEDDDDYVPARGKPDEVAVARASRPERTNCCRCRRPFTDLRTGGKSPGRHFCRACEAKRKAAQRRKKQRELIQLKRAA